MLQVLIVEDEIHSRETLKNLLRQYCSQVDDIKTAGSVDEGVNMIREYLPDLVFLDIEMQTGTGFDLLERCINYPFDVVFTTAYKDYAIKAIKFNAIDYLLKPIDFEELQQAVEKVCVRKKLNLQDNRISNLLNFFKNKPGGPPQITLSTAEGIEFIQVSDIIRCKAEGSYTVFMLKSGRHLLVSKNLKEYENLLIDYDFFRVHQSNLINLHEVEKFVKADGGYIVMKDGSSVHIAHSKKENFLRMMGRR
jgi:two-component system, LytTR family, response regulator